MKQRPATARGPPRAGSTARRTPPSRSSCATGRVRSSRTSPSTRSRTMWVSVWQLRPLAHASTSAHGTRPLGSGSPSSSTCTGEQRRPSGLSRAVASSERAQVGGVEAGRPRVHAPAGRQGEARSRNGGRRAVLRRPVGHHLAVHHVDEAEQVDVAPFAGHAGQLGEGPCQSLGEDHRPDVVHVVDVVEVLEGEAEVAGVEGGARQRRHELGHLLLDARPHDVAQLRGELRGHGGTHEDGAAPMVGHQLVMASRKLSSGSGSREGSKTCRDVDRA